MPTLAQLFGSRRRLTIELVILLLLVAGWLAINPPGRFGYHQYGLTVYRSLPIPGYDLLVFADGSWSRRAGKSHLLTADEYRAFLAANGGAAPDAVIVGLGYSSQVTVAPEILTSPGPRIEVLPTPEAIKRFNELRRSGLRVAAIIHSTC